MPKHMQSLIREREAAWQGRTTLQDELFGKGPSLLETMRASTNSQSMEELQRRQEQTLMRILGVLSDLKSQGMPLQGNLQVSTSTPTTRVNARAKTRKAGGA